MDLRLEEIRRSGRGVVFRWGDGLSGEVSAWGLRVACPCAHCVSETTGERILDRSKVPEGIELRDMQPVGNYAYRCLFGDGHDTGLYTLELLRRLCEAPPEET